MRKSDFTYPLPSRLIAQAPLPERSASRLLVVKGEDGGLEDRQFRDIVDLIQPRDILVFNDTKVIPARLYGRKETGGKVELLLERVLPAGKAWAQVRASKSPRPGSTILLESGYRCTVEKRENDLFLLAFAEMDDLAPMLREIGRMPLPPYIDRPAGVEDEARYQTVFARTPGAVAAPTAGLHFDSELLSRLKDKGIAMTFVTLHVGAGTFQPLREENLEAHEMHREWFEISEKAVMEIEKARSRGGRIIAVGTTVVRTLETACQDGKLKSGKGETRLFIRPGFRFRCVDAMITNFHLPESTLLMLVCAFAGFEPVMAAYHHAVEKGYRFFSYGDAMFLTRRTV